MLQMLNNCEQALEQTSHISVSLFHFLILFTIGKENRMVCSNKHSHNNLFMFKNINSDSKNLISPKLLVHHLLMQTILTQYRQQSHKTFGEQNQTDLNQFTLPFF
jgi:hypothetical protein